MSVGPLWLGILRLYKTPVDTGDYHTKPQLEDARRKSLAHYRSNQRLPIQHLIIPSIYMCVYLTVSLKFYLATLFIGWSLFSVFRIFPAKKSVRKLPVWFGVIGLPVALWLSYTANGLVYLQIWLSIVFGVMLVFLLIWPMHLFDDNASIEFNDKAFSFRLLFFPIPICLLFINEYLRINTSEIMWIWFYHFYSIGYMFLSILIVPLLITVFFKDE